MGANGQLFGWPAQLWHVLDQVGILLGLVLGAMALLSAVLGFVNRDAIRMWLRYNRFPAVGGEAAEIRDFEGLVFTVSREEVPVFVIEHVQPRAAVLLATTGSDAAANRIREAASRSKCRIEIQHISNPDDPAESRDQAAVAIRNLRRQGVEKIAVDITGGKAPMSIGAFMAAEVAGCPTLYVTAPYDRNLEQPDMRQARICRISQPLPVP